MNPLMILITTYIGKLYKFVCAKFKKKRTHLTLEVPLEIDNVHDYYECVVQTVKLMEQNINIKNK